jgi:phosphoglycolate phosphatase
MNRAFEEVFGLPDAFTTLDLAGRTDTSILADAFAGQGLATNAAAVQAFRERYRQCLAEEVVREAADKRVLPGITALLDALHPQTVSFLALLTGNYADTARIKLEHFGLWRYFKCGAFGDDSHDRHHLVPVALGRARAAGLSDVVDARQVIVVGDTPRDVACAAAHGASSIAVATGHYRADDLTRAGADVVFEDFSDTDAVLRAVDELLG